MKVPSLKKRHYAAAAMVSLIMLTALTLMAV